MLYLLQTVTVCTVILLTGYGLIALSLMLLIRIKRLFAPEGHRPPTSVKTQEPSRSVLHLLVARPLLLLATLGCVCAVVIFPQIIFAVIMLLAIGVLLTPIAERRGWGEGWLNRYLSRPPLVQADHMAIDRDGRHRQQTPRSK